ncbi:MAG: DUF3253 domain-containing protein [Gemmataceae bacterium]
MTHGEIHEAILRLLARRRPGASICPSEVARGTGRADWRNLMPAVRAAAAELARQGRLVVLQNGEVLPPDADAWVGPVRLGLPSRPVQ